MANKDAAKWTKVAAEVLAATAQQPEIAVLQQRHDDQVVALRTEHAQRLGLESAMPLRQAVDSAAILGHVAATVFPPQATVF